MSDNEMKNAAYAGLTEQGYLPTSKSDRMAVVSIVIDAVMADLRAKVEALRVHYHDDFAEQWNGALDRVLNLIDGGSDG